MSAGSWLAWRAHAKSRVLVQLAGEEAAMSGVLVRVAGPLLELRDARLLLPRQEPVALDGTVVVERHRVDWVQVLTAVSTVGTGPVGPGVS